MYITIGMPKAKIETNMSNIIRPTAAVLRTISFLMSLKVANMRATVSAAKMSDLGFRVRTYVRFVEVSRERLVA
jgi:hypothetical protein